MAIRCNASNNMNLKSVRTDIFAQVVSKRPTLVCKKVCFVKTLSEEKETLTSK